MRQAIIAAALLLTGCGTAPLERMAYMPPDEYLRPYKGTVVVMPQDPASPHISTAQERPTLGTCIIRLPAGGTVPTAQAAPFPTTMFSVDVSPRREAWRISDSLRRGLFLIELGGCNGALDVNADPARAVIPAGYERTVAMYDWSPVYRRLSQTAKWVGIAP